MKQYDFVVIGSGIAGLSFALKAAKHGSVAVVTKRKGADTNTAWAQGGIVVSGSTFSTKAAAMSKRSARIGSFWRRAGAEKFIFTRLILTLRPVMASRWLGARVRRLQIWSSFSFIRRVCFIRRRNHF